MKKILTIIVILLILTSFVYAKLSDETLKTVDDLRWKHYGYIKGDITCLDSTGYMSVTSSTFDYEWWSFYFEDGKLFVNTQDGKWFIEMEKIEEEK